MRLVITDIQKLNRITPKNYFKATVMSLFTSSCAVSVYFFYFCFRKKLSCIGEIPEACSGACASVVGQTLYVFGGHCALLGHSNHVSVI